jgi:hypothetical protein
MAGPEYKREDLQERVEKLIKFFEESSDIHALRPPFQRYNAKFLRSAEKKFHVTLRERESEDRVVRRLLKDPSWGLSSSYGYTLPWLTLEFRIKDEQELVRFFSAIAENIRRKYDYRKTFSRFGNRKRRKLWDYEIQESVEGVWFRGKHRSVRDERTFEVRIEYDLDWDKGDELKLRITPRWDVEEDWHPHHLSHCCYCTESLSFFFITVPDAIIHTTSWWRVLERLYDRIVPEHGFKFKGEVGYKRDYDRMNFEFPTEQKRWFVYFGQFLKAKGMHEEYIQYAKILNIAFDRRHLEPERAKELQENILEAIKKP